MTTRAERRADGSYSISGTKIFISCGDHDLSDNIVHCVLARLPGAPAGTKGILTLTLALTLTLTAGTKGILTLTLTLTLALTLTLTR